MKRAVALCLLAGVAAADDIGDASRACIDGGGAIGPCFGEETLVWQARFDAAMDALLGERSMEESNLGGLDPSTYSDRVPRLIEAQRSFERYRDDMCDFVSVAGRGTINVGVAWAACRMEVTAQHALRLESLLEAYQ